MNQLHIMQLMNQLHIITWGEKHRDAPVAVDAVYNVRSISYRRHVKDMDLSKTTGMDDELKNLITSLVSAKNHINNIIKDVKEKGHTKIAVICAHGWHRSVSVANYLKDNHFPDAVVYHYELEKYYPN